MFNEKKNHTTSFLININQNKKISMLKISLYLKVKMLKF